MGVCVREREREQQREKGDVCGCEYSALNCRATSAQIIGGTHYMCVCTRVCVCVCERERMCL